VVWFGVLYLEYSCALQSLHPVRPLIGSTLRYLASLAIPMSLLTALGALEVFRLLAAVRFAPVNRLASSLRSHPILTGAGAVIALALLTSRPIFDLGFAVPQRQRMASLPDGTKIFTHRVMLGVAFLVDPVNARRFRWFAPKSILERTPELEKLAASCDELWYQRKQLWMSRRKAMERRGSDVQPTLGSYFDTPERDWMLADALAKGNESDLVFYRRRPAGSPPPQIFTADSPEFRGLFPPLPATWSGQDEKKLATRWIVPPALRGKLLALEFSAASEKVEPLIVRLQFHAGRERRAEIALKPILHAGGGKEFFALAIPADAETCEVELRFAAKTKTVQLAGFRAFLDPSN
jgi:hypothetical protein